MAWHRHTSPTNFTIQQSRSSKASAFRFILWTVYSLYPTVSLRWPSFSSRRCTDLEQSSAAYHICSVTSCLLLSLEDILLQTLLPVITVVVPGKWHCHLWTRYSLLLTYLMNNHIGGHRKNVPLFSVNIQKLRLRPETLYAIPFQISGG